MTENQIQTYLRKLERQLWLRGLADADTLAEVESHLLEAVEVGVRQGLSQQMAEQKALERFGSVRVVAKTFERERKNVMQKIFLTVAVVTGLFIAYIDSRPTWDDTGVTVAAILLTSGLLTLLGYRKPWLIALGIGLWLPLYETVFSHSFSLSGGLLLLLFVLSISLMGAYAGWAVHLGIRRTLHLT